MSEQRVEQAEGVKRSAFVDTSLKILPLLYLNTPPKSIKHEILLIMFYFSH